MRGTVSVNTDSTPNSHPGQSWAEVAVLRFVHS